MSCAVVITLLNIFATHRHRVTKAGVDTNAQTYKRGKSSTGQTVSCLIKQQLEQFKGSPPRTRSSDRRINKKWWGWNGIGAVAKAEKQNWNSASLLANRINHCGSSTSQTSAVNLIKLYYLNGLSASLSDSADRCLCTQKPQSLTWAEFSSRHHPSPPTCDH